MSDYPINPLNQPPGGGMPPPQNPNNPYAPPQAPYQQPYAYDPIEESTPGKVVAGFILAFLCPIVGLILCIMGQKEIGPSGKGRGLATAGIVIAAINMLLGLVMNLSQM
jgi:hypothetical protein